MSSSAAVVGGRSAASAVPPSAASRRGARHQPLQLFLVDIVTSDSVVARIRSGNVTVQRYGERLVPSLTATLARHQVSPARSWGACDQERHMAALRLALLGPPSVEVGGAPLRVDTRKAVALLAYLACSGRRHGRDELAALLWPEADDAHARAALRRTLSALNHALGGTARAAADRSGLELVAPGMELDIRRFRTLVASCDAHGHEPERACAECAEPLAEAVALHRGDFLAGFALRDAPEYEDWQFAEADTLRRERAGALQRLVDAEAIRGRWQAAVAHAERWLALDPLHEPAHRQLMRLYAWSGQRGAAMRQYRACVRIL